MIDQVLKTSKKGDMTFESRLRNKNLSIKTKSMATARADKLANNYAL